MAEGQVAESPGRVDMRLIIFLFILCLPALSWGADKLPLKRGIFVDSTVKCSERSNVSVIAFWGDQLNVSKVEGNIVSVSRKGKRYKVLIDTETIEGTRGRENWTVTIKSRTHMVVTTPFATSTYLWCAEKMW
jgi:hypothetical protein